MARPRNRHVTNYDVTLSRPEPRPPLPLGKWTHADGSETLFDHAHRAMYSRPPSRTIVFRDHPANLIPWVREEYIKVPELDGSKLLAKVLMEFLVGRDVQPFLSKADVKHRKPLPVTLHPRYRTLRK